MPILPQWRQPNARPPRRDGWNKFAKVLLAAQIPRGDAGRRPFWISAIFVS